MSIAENLFLGREPKRTGFLGWLGALDKKRMLADATRHMHRQFTQADIDHRHVLALLCR